MSASLPSTAATRSGRRSPGRPPARRSRNRQGSGRRPHCPSSSSRARSRAPQPSVSTLAAPPPTPSAERQASRITCQRIDGSECSGSRSQSITAMASTMWRPYQAPPSGHTCRYRSRRPCPPTVWRDVDAGASADDGGVEENSTISPDAPGGSQTKGRTCSSASVGHRQSVRG